MIPAQQALVWTPALAVGVPELDDQHREIFARVDLLVAAMAGGEASEEVGRLLSFLGDYVTQHFAGEEKYMTDADFPGYPGHKAEHDGFIATLRVMTKTFEAEGSSPRLAMDVRRQSLSWLTEHISRADVAMARWIDQARADSDSGASR